MKFYNCHGKYKPELNEYFHMYRCQLNFAMFCAAFSVKNIPITAAVMISPCLIESSTFFFQSKLLIYCIRFFSS